MADAPAEHPLAAQNAALAAEIERLRASLRYRGADILAEARSPRGALAAPGRLVRLGAEARRAWAWRRAVLALECGLPDDPLRRAAPPAARVSRATANAARGAAVADGPAGDRLAELSRLMADGFGLPASAPLRAPPRRVAYVAHAGLPDTTNGYAVRTHALAKAMGTRGLDVTVLLRGGEAGRTETADGVRYRRIGALAPRGGYAETVAGYADALAVQLEDLRPDVVHAASNHVTGHAGAHAAARLGVPFAYEVRGLWEVTRLSVEPAYDGALGQRFQRAAELAIARAACAVFANGAPLGAVMAEGGVPPGRLFDLPNGCEAGLGSVPSPETRAAARAELGLIDAPVIGFVGSLTAYEGLGDVIQAAGHAGGCQVLIVGDGPAGPALRDAAARAPVLVTFTGRVAPARALAAYRAIDIAPIVRPRTPVAALVPPLKPLEAMAAGCAVVVSDLPPLRAMAAEGRATLVAPGAVADLAAAFTRLIDDADARRAQAERALEWVRAERSWDAGAGRVIAGYEAVADDKAAGAPSGTTS